MKVAAAGEGDFECPACGVEIDENQSVFYPYEPHNREVDLPCPSCKAILLIRPQQVVTFEVRLADQTSTSHE